MHERNLLAFGLSYFTNPILNSGGDFGFDVGCKAVQGIPRASYLVNTTGNAINANDERYALAA